MTQPEKSRKSSQVNSTQLVSTQGPVYGRVKRYPSPQARLGPSLRRWSIHTSGVLSVVSRHEDFMDSALVAVSSDAQPARTRSTASSRGPAPSTPVCPELEEAGFELTHYRRAILELASPQKVQARWHSLQPTQSHTASAVRPAGPRHGHRSAPVHRGAPSHEATPGHRRAPVLESSVTHRLAPRPSGEATGGGAVRQDARADDAKSPHNLQHDREAMQQRAARIDDFLSSVEAELAYEERVTVATLQSIPHEERPTLTTLPRSAVAGGWTAGRTTSAAQPDSSTVPFVPSFHRAPPNLPPRPVASAPIPDTWRPPTQTMALKRLDPRMDPNGTKQRVARGAAYLSQHSSLERRFRNWTDVQA